MTTASLLPHAGWLAIAPVDQIRCARRMMRLPSRLIGLSLLLFTACTPRDPLEWKIDGRNSAELQAWLVATIRRMPPPLADEFSTAVVRIRDDTRGWAKADPKATNNPLSLRLHGRKVRDVLVEGLQLQAGDFLSRVKNDQSNILRIAESLARDDLSPTERARLETQLYTVRRASRANERAFEALEKRINTLLSHTELN